MNRIAENLNSDEKLAHRVIGLAMAVHRELGCGFVESVYEKALLIELEQAKIAFEVQPILPVFYKDTEIGIFQADIIIEKRLIVELKAVDGLAIAHSIQLINYLSAAKIEHGLLLNFGTKSLQFRTKTRTPFLDASSNDPIDLHS